MTPREYFMRVAGYYRRLEDQHWEPVRWLGWVLACVNASQEHPAPALEEMMPLRKDRLRPAPAGPTPEDTRALWARLDELDKDLLIPAA